MINQTLLINPSSPSQNPKEKRNWLSSGELRKNKTENMKVVHLIFNKPGALQSFTLELAPNNKHVLLTSKTINMIACENLATF